MAIYDGPDIQTINNVISILSTTRWSLCGADEIDIPLSGSEPEAYQFNLYDTDGNMEDPDGSVVVRAVRPDGTFLPGRLYQSSALLANLNNPVGAEAVTWPVADGWRVMEYTSPGIFYFYYANTAGDTDETITFEVEYQEDGVTLHGAGALSLVETKARAGTRQVQSLAITSAADAGDVTLFTGDGDVMLESFVIRATSAVPVVFSWAELYFDDNLVLNRNQLSPAALDTAGESVVWPVSLGPFLLKNTSTIDIHLEGTAATAVDLEAVVTFYAVNDGGTLT